MPSAARLENFLEKYYAERSEAGNFFKEKFEIRALKSIVELLKCILGPPDLGVRGGARAPGAPPLDPLVISV